MEKLTVTNVKEVKTDSKGERLRTSDGSPYSWLKIQTEKYGDKWLSGFKNGKTAQIQEGTVIKTEVTKQEKNGYTNWNYDQDNIEIVEGGKKPTANKPGIGSVHLAITEKVMPWIKQLGKKVNEMEQRQKEILNTVEAIYESQVDQPTEDIPVSEDIAKEANPFEEEEIDW